MKDPGETSLSKLFSTLISTPHPTTYVFATFSDHSALPRVAEIQLFFREAEGVTVITTLEYATAQKINYFFPCRMITLNVTSSLEAVGFMAVLATRLAEANIGVNPVRGFYHDHLFVPAEEVDETASVLKVPNHLIQSTECLSCVELTSSTVVSSGVDQLQVKLS